MRPPTSVMVFLLAIATGLAILAALAIWAVPARGQEHQHGKGGVPDWYDPSCCSNMDCKPVEDSDIEFSDAGGPVVRYKPTGNVFHHSHFRKSQDERYHVCINPNSGVSLCFYDRAGI